MKGHTLHVELRMVTTGSDRRGLLGLGGLHFLRFTFLTAFAAKKVIWRRLPSLDDEDALG